MSLWLLKKRKCGRGRRMQRRFNAGTRRYLRMYGYVTEWSLKLWRFKRKKEHESGED